ncbi:MAG TPA: hypothetical protein VFY51_10845 [Pyrinomonadaceae bacterium]|nr:hypothetical protein [Pyrinomonadaceae bacterium]
MVGQGFSKLTALGLKTKGSREMNSVGQSGERKSYRVILLLVVGLTAFSSAMKELNLLREFSHDTSNLVASLSKAVTPETPTVPEVVVPVPVQPVVEEVEICDNSHTLPEVESVDRLKSGGDVARVEVKIKDVGKTVVAERSRHRNVPSVATFRSNRSADFDVIELRRQAPRESDLRVMIMADSDGEVRIPVPSDFEFKAPKVKTYRHVIRPEERELLKSLNRSFNLRSAG